MRGKLTARTARNIAAACGIAVAGMTGGAANASFVEEVFLSVRDNTGVQLAGLPMLDGDVVRYDMAGHVASVYLPEAAFTAGSIDLNAVHLQSNGSVVFSTLFNGVIGGLAFGDGDIVTYDPVTDTAQVLVSESLWSGSVATDVNAVFVRGDGRVVLSHNNDMDVLGGLAFTDGDLVEYDPLTDSATLLAAESMLFDDLNGDIDALHELDDGRFLLSFADDEMINGVSFRDGDVIAYDLTNDAATLYFSEDLFDSAGLANDTNAFSIATLPAPGAMALLGLAGLCSRRRAEGSAPSPVGAGGAAR